MKRANIMFFSMVTLVLFLSGSAGAHRIARGGSECGDPAGWNTGGKAEKCSSLIAPFDSQASFCVEDTESLYDDLFTTTRAFATPYVNLNGVVRDVNGRDLSDGGLNYHAHFCVADLWKDAPDIRRGINLLEGYGLFCDHTGMWVILDTIQDEANSAPVPEPGTLLLIGSGLVSAGLISRRRRKTKPEQLQQ